MHNFVRSSLHECRWRHGHGTVTCAAGACNEQQGIVTDVMSRQAMGEYGILPVFVPLC